MTHIAEKSSWVNILFLETRSFMLCQQQYHYKEVSKVLKISLLQISTKRTQQYHLHYSINRISPQCFIISTLKSVSNKHVKKNTFISFWEEKVWNASCSQAMSGIQHVKGFDLISGSTCYKTVQNSCTYRHPQTAPTFICIRLV